MWNFDRILICLGDRGYFCESTMFVDVTDDMTIATDEIFGPVMQVLRFNEDEDLDKIIERANNTNYGLAAAIYSTNNERITRLSRSIKAGMVWINCYDIMDSNTPFGGFKQSGIGRENGEYGLSNFLQVKSVINNMGDNPGTWYWL